MPELPEVETVRRGLASVLENAVIEHVKLNRADLRFPFGRGFAAKLKGARIVNIGRRAKYLLFHLSNGHILLAHLGMSGRFRFEDKKGAQDPGRFYAENRHDPLHDHVVINLKGGQRLTYNDSRRFGFMEILDQGSIEQRFATIGFEPLSSKLSGPTLCNKLKRKKTPVKIALLDQGLIAGIGNIYACEALFAAKIAPDKPAGELSQKQCGALAASIKTVLKKAIELGGSTLRDFEDAKGKSGSFQHEFCVYDRENRPCLRCKTAIKRFMQGGRSSFYCPCCQR